MKLLTTAARIVEALSATFAAPPPLTGGQRDEALYRREINARGARRRAEFANTLDKLLSDRPRWIRRTAGWARLRKRETR